MGNAEWLMANCEFASRIFSRRTPPRACLKPACRSAEMRRLGFFRDLYTALIQSLTAAANFKFGLQPIAEGVAVLLAPLLVQFVGTFADAPFQIGIPVRVVAAGCVRAGTSGR